MTAAEVGDHILPEGFAKDKVNVALNALVNRAKTSVETGLFPDVSTRILMDITTFKIPEAKNHFFNIVLPHTPYPEDVDILLVIPDDVKTPTEPEVLVAEVKDRLQRALPFRIREVMTLKQLKDEYSTFEGKRQLAKSIDLILSDIRVFKNLSAILGREFYRKKKYPIALKLDPRLKHFDSSDFEYALRKTVLNISTHGITTTIVVGQTNLTQTELTENVAKISNWLMRQFPGEWKNIAKLSLYCAGVPPLIVYHSTGTRNDIEGRVFGKKRKLALPEEDELSTMPGRRVRVHADGRIRVLKEELEGSDEELIAELGVEEELTGKRIRNDVNLEAGIEKKKKKTKKQGKLNLEEKYVDETIKRQDFEDEEAEAAAAEAEAEDEAAAPKSKASKKRKAKKMRKVKK